MGCNLENYENPICIYAIYNPFTTGCYKARKDLEEPLLVFKCSLPEIVKTILNYLTKNMLLKL